MTEASRKRSRKSKLVLRDCALDDEGDIELQVPAAKVLKETKKEIQKKPKPKSKKKVSPKKVHNKNVLKKIQAPVEEQTEPTTPRKFDINVEIEVETCDDEFLNTSEENGDQAKTAEHIPPTNKSPNKIENVPANKNTTEPIFLLRDNILDASNKINQTSHNIADKILDICVKNNMGFIKKQNVHSWQESKIQEALDTWQDWQSASVHRENPLFYKCYICTTSWWDLSEFRDHISIHTELSIDIEQYGQHQCNVIAFEDGAKPEEAMEIQTDGLCYRCGKSFDAHNLSLMGRRNYCNSGRSKLLYTCTQIRDHANACKVCRGEDNEFQCMVCNANFFTEELLNNHLVLLHAVRSDRPIAANYKTCEICSEVYSSRLYHLCGTKAPHSQCPYCFTSILNKSLILDHINRSNKSCRCEICGQELKWSCQKYEHMLKHTNKYTFVKMCVKCDGINVFVNEESLKRHKSLNHRYRDSQHDRYFPRILVPKSCIYSNQEELEIKSEPESVPENEESEPMQEESVWEQNLVIKKESIPEQNLSVPSQQHESLLKNDPKSLLKKPNLLNRRVLVSNQESILNRVSILKRRQSIPKQQQSILKPQDSTPDQSVMQSNHGLEADVLTPVFFGSDELRKRTENVTENIIVKEEPMDSDDSSRLVIKEEPIDDFDDYDNRYEYSIEENQTENIVQTNIKQEDEDVDEFEDDIIKLNINIEDLLAKQESSRVFEHPSVRESNEQTKSITETEEMPRPIKIEKESILEPEIVISDVKQKNLYRCSKCPFKGKHKSYIEHIETDCPQTMGNKHYTCTKCGLDYACLKIYLGHFMKHGFKCLSCPECLKQFYTFGKLGPHVLSHIKQNFVRIKTITHELTANQKPGYQCRKCGKTVKIDEFFQHWELHISCNPRRMAQAVEERSPRLEGSISESVIQDCITCMQQSPKQCVYCKRRFKRVNECKRHIIEHLLADAYSQKQLLGVLKCQICNIGYSAPEKYKQHMRDHASLPVYKCEICDRTFSDSSNFTKHKKVHNLKVVICDLCGKKFQSKTSLAKHLEQHKKSEPITCKICFKIFYFETTYKRHVRYYHEKVTLGYRCVICNERFNSLKSKWDHMWEVHKERKNKADCPVCFRSFRKYSEVRAHAKRDHNKEVSVFSVKNATKSMDDIHKFLDDSGFKIGDTETLVVYGIDDS